MPGWAVTPFQGQGPECRGRPGHSPSSFAGSMHHRQCCQRQGVPVWKGLSHATSIHSITLGSTQGWATPLVSLHKHLASPWHPSPCFSMGFRRTCLFWGLKLPPLEPGWGKMPTNAPLGHHRNVPGQTHLSPICQSPSGEGRQVAGICQPETHPSCCRWSITQAP